MIAPTKSPRDVISIRGAATTCIGGSNVNTLRQVFSHVKKVLRNDLIGECWEWQLSHDGGGRAQVSFRGKITRVSRLVFFLLGEPLTKEKPHVCHICDNGLCCNPAHLFPGSHKDNMRDAAFKGRSSHKIEPHEIETARSEYAKGMPVIKIARMLGRRPDAVKMAICCERASVPNVPVQSIRSTSRSESARKKLTDDDVRYMLSLKMKYGLKSSLARKFGVSESTISRIFSGKRRERLRIAING